MLFRLLYAISLTLVTTNTKITTTNGQRLTAIYRNLLRKREYDERGKSKLFKGFSDLLKTKYTSSLPCDKISLAGIHDLKSFE